jgi:hypothetical protein
MVAVLRQRDDMPDISGAARPERPDAASGRPGMDAAGVLVEFERCWPWLEAAVERHGNTHEKHHLWRLIERGSAHLLPLPNAAVVGNIINYPTGLKRGNAWLAGGVENGSIREILDAVAFMEAWAQRQNCNQGSVYGRRGWRGPLLERGYRELSTLFVKDF